MSHGRFQIEHQRALPKQLSDGVAPLTAVAAAFSLDPEQLSEWIDAGLLNVFPAAGDAPTEIDIRDLTTLRGLCDGVAAPARGRFRGILDRIEAWSPPQTHAVKAVTLVAGDAVVWVRLPDGTLADPMRQFKCPACVDPSFGRIGPPSPTTAVQWHERGIEQEISGDIAAAIVSYGNALRMGGPDAQINFDLAYALAETHQTDRAIERYRQVVEIDPRRQDAWINLGDLLLTAGSSADAIESFRHALAIDPDDADAHYGLAEALDDIGDQKTATLHWKRFQALPNGTAGQHRYAAGRIG